MENNNPAADQDDITKKAEQIAQEKIESLKQGLVQSISGKQSRYGENGPKSWDDLHDSIKSDATEEAVRLAEERVLKKLEAKEKEEQQEQEQLKKQQEETKKQEWARMTQEWNDAVEDGLLPDINEDVKVKLKDGKTYEDLTQEERNDPGLKAYNDLVATHMKLKAEGKSNSLYRTAQKYFNKQPAGAGAPVFGSTPPATPPAEEEYSYDEVAQLRKQRFGV